MNLEIGSTLGDYQIIGILGAGGMGRVYKVRNTISDRIEAMKVLLPDLSATPELTDRFMREIKVQASLVHPNIAAFHTAVRVNNQLLMLMEFLEGATLAQRLEQGRISAPEAVEYVRQVLTALEYAHQRGVIHRDIKPANMMLVGSGTVKLMDFGIAKAASDQRLTMTGMTLGSLYYMPPEQIRGATDLDARADLYSVGVSLYEFVTGTRPFDGDSQFAIMSAHLEKNPAPPLSIDPSLPQSLNNLILQSVAKDPKDRFQTAAAFRDALAAVAAFWDAPTATQVGPAPAHQTITTPVPPPQAAAEAGPFIVKPAQSEPPKNRRGVWVALGAAAAVLAVVVMIQFGPLESSRAAPQVPQTSVRQAQPPQTAPAQTAAQEPAPRPVVPVTIPPRAQTVPTKPMPRQTTSVQAFPPAVEQRPASHAAAPAQVVSQPAPQPPTSQSVAPSQAEMMEFREHLMMINTRAGGVRASLQALKSQQAAAGMNLRGDMQEAVDLMDSYLRGAQGAIQAGDLPAARGYADKGERQLEKLEKFLNR